jgi:hypothetical protein
MNSRSDIKSFYIPRVYMNTTEQYVKYIFNLAGIGMPFRVDFTPIGKVSGFKEDTRTSVYKSAFVHFHTFYEGAYSVISFEGLNAGMFQSIEYEPYWRILKNRNPVSTTMMNCHQIVANCCVLEEKVAQLEKKVEQLEEYKDCDADTFRLLNKRINMLETNFYKLAEFVFEKDRQKLECGDSLGPTNSEIVSADEMEYEDDSEQEEIMTPSFLHEVSKHLDQSWLEDAVAKVEAHLRDVRDSKVQDEPKERIAFTKDICGNE